MRLFPFSLLPFFLFNTMINYKIGDTFGGLSFSVRLQKLCSLEMSAHTFSVS